ncbi:MAG: hypothetical protein AAGJ82_15315 [Bacteroidota bacterium]
MESKTQIATITAEQTWPIRHAVMWPNEPLDYVRLPEDASGFHLGLLVEGRLVAVVSAFIEAGTV